MSVRDEVIREMSIVGVEQNKRLAPLTDNLPLLETGLDSLCFAIIVARLEGLLNIDPFNEAAEHETLPTTVGELVRFYQDALKVPS